MWNKNRSVILSLIVCVLIGVILTLILFAFPTLCPSYFRYYRGITDAVRLDFLKIVTKLCFYPCLMLGYTALYTLIRLLLNIKNEDIFIFENVKYLRILSWCCFGVCAITLFGVIRAKSMFALLVISAAAGFVGLILRVVKNVIEAAVEIRMENDLTI